MRKGFRNEQEDAPTYTSFAESNRNKSSAKSDPEHSRIDDTDCLLDLQPFVGLPDNSRSSTILATSAGSIPKWKAAWTWPTDVWGYASKRRSGFETARMGTTATSPQTRRRSSDIEPKNKPNASPMRLKSMDEVPR